MENIISVIGIYYTDLAALGPLESVLPTLRTNILPVRLSRLVKRCKQTLYPLWDETDLRPLNTLISENKVICGGWGKTEKIHSKGAYT